jgi:hypothetical protein
MLVRFCYFCVRAWQLIALLDVFRATFFSSRTGSSKDTPSRFVRECDEKVQTTLLRLPQQRPRNCCDDKWSQNHGLLWKLKRPFVYTEKPSSTQMFNVLTSIAAILFCCGWRAGLFGRDIFFHDVPWLSTQRGVIEPHGAGMESSQTVWVPRELLVWPQQQRRWSCMCFCFHSLSLSRVVRSLWYSVVRCVRSTFFFMAHRTIKALDLIIIASFRFIVIVASIFWSSSSRSPPQRSRRKWFTERPWCQPAVWMTHTKPLHERNSSHENG